MTNKKTPSGIEVSGFTPLLDSLVKEFGIVTAAVFGRVWRYCQGDRHVCTASIGRISEELNVNRRTVLRHLKVLVEEGYLIDNSTNIRNRPHTYAVVRKVMIREKIGMAESHCTVAESHTGVTKSPSGCDRESLEETMKKQYKKKTKVVNYFFDLIPDGINTEEFRQVWKIWIEYRKKEKKKPITQTSAKLQLNDLSTYSIEIAIKTLEKSMMQGWQGIFPENCRNMVGGNPSVINSPCMNVKEKIKQNKVSALGQVVSKK